MRECYFLYNEGGTAVIRPLHKLQRAFLYPMIPKRPTGRRRIPLAESVLFHEKKDGDKSMKPGKQQSCESCGNYVYDEEYEYYVCEASLDEDDMVRFLKSQNFQCPFYQWNDEYRIVRKQM